MCGQSGVSKKARILMPACGPRFALIPGGPLLLSAGSVATLPSCRPKWPFVGGDGMHCSLSGRIEYEEPLLRD
jgi:hypothetical protein